MQQRMNGNEMKTVAAGSPGALVVRSAALGAAAAVFAVSAHAADPAIYVGAQFGVNDLNSWPAQVDFGAGVKVDGRQRLGSGNHYGLAVGRQTAKGRFELEYQRGDMKLRGIELGPVSETAGGSGHYEALTVNAYRTHAFNESVSGYLGVGIGWGAVSLPRASFSTGCNCFPAASEDGLAYLARLGAEYRFGEGHHAFLQYTWLSLPGPSALGSAPGVEYSRRGIGAVSVGYRKHF